MYSFGSYFKISWHGFPSDSSEYGTVNLKSRHNNVARAPAHTHAKAMINLLAYWQTDETDILHESSLLVKHL